MPPPEVTPDIASVTASATSGGITCWAAGSPAFPIKSGNLSFGLGAGVEVTPLSMANAFGTLMNHGVHMKPRYVREIRTQEGGVVIEVPDKPKPVRRALETEVADQVVEAMSGVTKPGGTAIAARQDFPVYGKTGTTNDSTDAWFIGCAKSPQNLCLSVWMGYEDQSCKGVEGSNCGGMKNVNGVEQVYGGTLPAQIFDRTFEILREIQAEKRRAAAGEAESTADPSPAATRTRGPRRTQAPATNQPEPSPEPVLPSPAEPSLEPEPSPEPSQEPPPLLPTPASPAASPAPDEEDPPAPDAPSG